MNLGLPGLHSIHWKVFAFHLAVLVLPVGYLAWELRQNLEKTHLQATEEGMIDTAALAGNLYAHLATDLANNPAQMTTWLSKYLADFRGLPLGQGATLRLYARRS